MAGIDTPRSLREHLQTAIEIEWSTIPPYLCALWSIEDGANQTAASCIQDVVMEEMLHLTLAANVLNALDGTPRLLPPGGVAPCYPTALPHSDESFQVSLLRFSHAALDTFRRIERPALIGARPQPDRYATIAQFYESIIDAIERLGEEPIWKGPRARQVEPGSQYYGGGGDAIVVTGRDSALEALQLVVDEGEGFAGGVFDGDHEILGEAEELAHYFRFDELLQGRRYVRGDRPSTGPTGPPIMLDYDAVLPMRANPRVDDHPPGSELRALAGECDATYARVLATLEGAFGGRPEALADGVRDMWSLKYQAVGLMRVPVGDGETAGPPFTPPRGSAPQD